MQSGAATRVAVVRKRQTNLDEPSCRTDIQPRLALISDSSKSNPMSHARKQPTHICGEPLFGISSITQKLPSLPSIVGSHPKPIVIERCQRSLITRHFRIGKQTNVGFFGSGIRKFELNARKFQFKSKTRIHTTTTKAEHDD
jgi:hypothetical protein